MLISLLLWYAMQIPLVSNSEADVVRNQTCIDPSAQRCSCGIRQELTKAIDEIAWLRYEMNKERVK